MALNKLQQKILEELRRAVEAGESFSLRSLGNIFNIAGNTALYHLRRLEDAGFIVRDVNGKVVRVNSPDEQSAVAFLPLLATNIPCGQPLAGSIVEENTTRMIPVPLRLLGRNTNKQLYLIKAVGDSMYPKIEEEDIVIFEPGQPQSGDIVVARLKDGFTIKVFKEMPDQYILKPINKDYQPFVFDKNQSGKTFNIDGKAVGVFKPQENLGGGDD